MSYVYFLRDEFTDKSELGNKGANLVIMTRLGLPVPPGFVVSIEAYKQFGKTGIIEHKAVETAMAALEEQAGKKLGKGLEVSCTLFRCGLDARDDGYYP